MDKFLPVIKRLAKHAALRSLSFPQLVEFLSLVSVLKRNISLARRAEEPSDQPPGVLPRLIQRFLAESLGVDMSVIFDAWPILKHYAWDMPHVSTYFRREKEAFSAYGWGKGLSGVSFQCIFGVRLIIVISSRHHAFPPE
jgi:hypothetical protein